MKHQQSMKAGVSESFEAPEKCCYFSLSCVSTAYHGLLVHTAISRKAVGKNVHATIPKGNMGYDQFTVPDTVAFEPTFVTFL